MIWNLLASICPEKEYARRCVVFLDRESTDLSCFQLENSCTHCLHEREHNVTVCEEHLGELTYAFPAQHHVSPDVLYGDE